MDRFIGFLLCSVTLADCYLKSNMDRFIGSVPAKVKLAKPDLKSNMDRFIVLPRLGINIVLTQFKIQYG